MKRTQGRGSEAGHVLWVQRERARSLLTARPKRSFFWRLSCPPPCWSWRLSG